MLIELTSAEKQALDWQIRSAAQGGAISLAALFLSTQLIGAIQVISVLLCLAAAVGFAIWGLRARVRILEATPPAPPGQAYVGDPASAIIRGIRGPITVVAILLLSIPFLFVAYFFLTYMRGEQFGPRMLVLCAVVASIPYSYSWSEPHYKLAKVQHCRKLELLYGCTPFFWTLFLALVGYLYALLG